MLLLPLLLLLLLLAVAFGFCPNSIPVSSAQHAYSTHAAGVRYRPFG
jgi:hypothetical protein